VPHTPLTCTLSGTIDMMYLSVVSTDVKSDMLPYGVYLIGVRQSACP
jgi:hypothetical protein